MINKFLFGIKDLKLIDLFKQNLKYDKDNLFLNKLENISKEYMFNTAEESSIFFRDRKEEFIKNLSVNFEKESNFTIFLFFENLFLNKVFFFFFF
jgi:hypothetical protein